MFTTAYQLLSRDTDTLARLQLQNGAVHIASDAQALLFQTGAATDGRAGKSAASLAFQPTRDSTTITLEAGIYIPEGAPNDGIVIADFESANASTGTNPGTRIYLSDGYLRVDRSKIGIAETWDSTPLVQIDTGQWHDIRVELTPGAEENGGIRVFVDGLLVLQETGTTILTQDALAGTGHTLSGGQIDRVQMGVTSYLGQDGAMIALRDVSLSIDDATTGRHQTLGLDPKSALAHADQVVELPEDDAVRFLGAASPEDFATVGTADGDTLYGDPWDNVLQGGAGDDILHPGAGNDTMTGGDGADQFHFNGGWGMDVITDYQPGIDRIVFDFRADSMTSFDVYQHSLGAVVHDGRNGILLENVDMASLTIDDFDLIL